MRLSTPGFFTHYSTTRSRGTETRENLKDFLLHVDVQGFELYGVEVKREWKKIDILLTNANKKALVIENKINAGDQDKQLWRYYNTLKEQDYLDRNIHLIYLTLDGREPTSDSIGDLDPEKITTVAYKKLIPWLERCQKRAYDEIRSAGVGRAIYTARSETYTYRL